MVEGDAESAIEELGRLVFDKSKQLNRRVVELLDGDWQIPDRAIEQVERIWPVVVTADVLQSSLLWEEIRERLPGSSANPKSKN